MSLPEIMIPSTVPAFTVDGHGIDLYPMYAPVKYRTGHMRMRRIFTTVPRVVDVRLWLNQTQMTALDDHFETALNVGTRQFAARVAKQGPGLLWWAAQWVEPYKAEPSSGRWLVTGKLLLTSDGSATAPTATTMTLAVSARLSGNASLTVTAGLSLAITAALLPATGLELAFGAALEKA